MNEGAGELRCRRHYFYKEKLGEIDGVTDVTWLDDAVTEKQVQILKKTSSIPRLLIRKHEQVQ